MIGVYAGSFDPFTNGHLAIVRQAGGVFDKVVILVADNPEKRHWLSGSERREIIEGSVTGEVEVDILTGVDTAVEYAYRLGGCLIRGLGEFTDYSAEKTLAGVNSRLRPEVQTVFLMTRDADNQMRSSAVREALKYRFGWRSLRDTVPRATLNAALLRLLAVRAETLGLAFKLDRDSLARYLDRPYHNLEHLVYMLDLAEIWDREAEFAEVLDLWAAIVYHDLLVDSDPDVEAGEDVDRSLQKLDQIELPGCSREKVLAMIRATDHRHYSFCPDPQVKMSPAQSLMRRLDLAILGESPSEYARYAEAVAREYAPKYGYLSEAFLSGRTAFLETLLQRLKAGPIIDAEYDERISVNARWELGQLAQAGPGRV